MRFIKWIILAAIIGGLYLGYQSFFKGKNITNELDMICTVAKKLNNNSPSKDQIMVFVEKIKQLPLSPEMTTVLNQITSVGAYEKLQQIAKEKGMANWNCDDLKKVLEKNSR